MFRSAALIVAVLVLAAFGVSAAQSTWDHDAQDPIAPTPVAGVDYPLEDAPAGNASTENTPVEAAVAEEVLAVARLITYQGRLLTPSTGVNKPDGNYEITFRIYNHATATAQANLRWMETQTVPVSKGLFSVALGSVTPIPSNVFTGQNLWLGVTVGTDPELAPRTRITAVAYALYAENAATAANATNAANAANAALLDNIDSTTFATEEEVLPLVRAGDGSGSQVDADFLDGLDSGAFARNLGYALAATWANQCIGAGVTTGFYHYQVASADDVRLWKLRPLADDTQFAIVNFSFRRHFGNYAYHFQVTNTGTTAACFDILYYRLQ